MAERITVTEREPDPGQQWKCGDEFLPFHPQASHVPPDYRDGWNRCYWMAVGRPVASGMAQAAGEGQQAVAHLEWLHHYLKQSPAAFREWCGHYDAVRAALLASPAVAPSAQPLKLPDEAIKEWAERHDLGLTLTELRGIFEDAQSLHLTIGAAPSAQEPQAAEQSAIDLLRAEAITLANQYRLGMDYYGYSTKAATLLVRLADALLAATKQPAQEPVGWRVRGYSQFKTGAPGPWRYFDGPAQPKINDPECCDIEPVFASAPSASAAPVVAADAVRDAERYRWLRGHAGQLCAANGLLWESETDVFNNEKDATSLDAAIDWAMHSTDAREEASNATGTAANQTEGKA